MKPTGEHLDGYRMQRHPYESPPGELFGAFAVGQLRIISSGVDEEHGWEHVSISRADRCPTWDEMSRVKDLFWGPEEAVLQFHPPKRDYVNFHPFTLHLWRPVDGVVRLPPSILVGQKGGTRG